MLSARTKLSNLVKSSGIVNARCLAGATTVSVCAREVAEPRKRSRFLSSTMSSGIPGPHASIATDVPQERFALNLFDRLWDKYRERVSHVRVYESLVNEKVKPPPPSLLLFFFRWKPMHALRHAILNWNSRRGRHSSTTTSPCAASPDRHEPSNNCPHFIPSRPRMFPISILFLYAGWEEAQTAISAVPAQSAQFVRPKSQGIGWGGGGAAVTRPNLAIPVPCSHDCTATSKSWALD